ncbi:hypothetical protein BCIN_05g06370 [Botrytis cinerea B05.10]|uniref:Uncharacterized protein n=2 Tax=Botryotinia fuckeliana TaxID=40559 RepID=A0A384JI83_BOTFB|nr:hypothetical protein BCIN_05g06370 [Botrytis cinerea B05.10]ATZ50270.1 hypothetical protein BCIN_05g06370 [Botrytis cinerea B05.10]CCD53440.1 hypothetical protein BofuT4_P134850.1 [Botrytis cinerea T4]
MGNKNNRGRAPIVRAANQYAAKLAAEKQKSAQLIQAQKQQAELAEAQELAQKKALARQQVFDFDYTSLPKHSALSVKKIIATGEVKLIINHDIVHRGLTAKDSSFLTILPIYANLITKFEFQILAPSYYESREIYLAQVENIMNIISCLNNFHIEEFHFVVSLNKAYNFQQMKLAAAVHNLYFRNWTMTTKVRGVAGTWNVDSGNEWDRKLARIYKQDFLTFTAKAFKIVD